MEACTSTRSLVKLAQSQLNRSGFNAGAEDGVLGRGTREAISKFQESKGLEVNGELNGPTLAALQIDPNTDGYAPLGGGFIVGANSIKPGETVYVDFLNFYGHSRGRDFCFRVSRDVRLQN
jgi:peptidoglycan hydrolase-like protein with peptidoglycan-binding domain